MLDLELGIAPGQERALQRRACDEERLMTRILGGHVRTIDDERRLSQPQLARTIAVEWPAYALQRRNAIADVLAGAGDQ
jgi:hypothetical protein